MLDEVEESGVGPVDVLENQNGRSLRRESLEIAAPREERLVPGNARHLLLRTHERSEPISEPNALGLLSEHIGDGVPQLPKRLVR